MQITHMILGGATVQFLSRGFRGRQLERDQMAGSDGSIGSRQRLFLVESPFQLISATEAREKFHRGSGAALVYVRRLSDRPINDEQIFRLKGEFGWTDFTLLKLSHPDPIRRHLKVRAFTNKFKKLHKFSNVSVFIGEYKNPVFYLISRILMADEVFIMDDGTSVLGMGRFPAGIQPFIKKYEQAGFLGSLILKMIHGPLSIKSGCYAEFYQFSCISSPQTSCLYLKNDFCFLRSLVNKRREKKGVVLIGQKLSEAGIVSRGTESEILERILWTLCRASEDVYYAPHRDDSQDKIDLVSSLSGVKILYTDLPIEVFLLSSNWFPERVLGFYSTALFSLKLIFPDLPIFCYRIPDKLVVQKHKNNVTQIYDELRALGIQIYESISDNP